MKVKSKAVLVALSVALIVVASVFSTMAYFTSQDTATNTFTVGNVTITLDEKNTDKLDKNGDASNAERDDANTYKLIPGETYEKDPTVHVAADSEPCWVFVKVDNGLVDVETKVAADTIVGQMTKDNTWTLIDQENGIYAYKEIVNAGGQAVVFKHFTINGAGVTKEKLEEAAENPITVTAYAIQAHGFDSAEAAWSGASDELGLD